jgi:hypothetical protein
VQLEQQEAHLKQQQQLLEVLLDPLDPLDPRDLQAEAEVPGSEYDEDLPLHHHLLLARLD